MNTDTDKKIRLLNYLEELSRLRIRSVKNIDSYQKVLWLNEIPQNLQHCYTRAWGPNENYDPDIWIQVRKYDEPVLEDIPEICEEWIDNSKLYDTTSIPELLQSIQTQIEEENPDWTPDDPLDEKVRTVNRTLHLQDHSDVLREWEKFVSQKWTPWAELHKKWEEVQSVYSKLFSFYQEQLKLGEEYELILGLGFLSWQSDKGYFIKRHLIAANANLDFDTKIGKFTINPAIDGAKLSLEFDMFEPDDQPSYKARKPIEEFLCTANDDPWNRSILDTVQKSLVNILGKGQGEVRLNNLDIDENYEKTKPLLNFAPALILRKRNTKILQQVIQKIKEQVNAGVKVPKAFIDLCEGKVEKCELSENDEENSDIPKKKQLIDDNTIYFPLPSNEEQNEIISKVRSTSGVLVQGPPGTGKSHTIANLICHFLATGKRILVTAKTPRALRVLHDKLPASIQPLCINLLGTGLEEQKSLESSVVNILTKQDRWSEKYAKKSIEKNKEKLYQLKKEKSKLDFMLRSIKESESIKHSLIDKQYTGTAAKIALKIQKESKLYNWFEDIIPYDLKCPFSIDTLTQLREKLKELTSEKKEQLRLKLPTPNEDYPDLDKFSTLAQEEKRLIGKTASRSEVLKTDLGHYLSRSDDIEKIQNVIKEILRLNAAVDSISKRPLSWIRKAVYDILSDKDTPWRDLLTVLHKKLDGLKEKSYTFENMKFDIVEQHDKRKLLEDAKLLYKHIKKGGKLGFGILAPKIVRKTRYIFKVVKINGQECCDLLLLEKLIEFLELKESVAYCWTLWNGKIDRNGGPLFLQIGELEELEEALKSVVEIYDYLVKVKQAISKIEGLGEVAWHEKKAISNLLNLSQAYVSIYDLEKIENELKNYESRINIFKNNSLIIHPLTDELLMAINERSIDKYSMVLSKIEQYKKEVGIFETTNNTLISLSELAPKFTQSLSSDFENADFKKHIFQFERAWDWARAKSWLTNILNKDDFASLEKRAKQIEDNLKKQLTDLASLLAWKFCFTRMHDTHRQHLMGWQQAIKKIGKGTGKHAPKHRKDAQEHLSQCRDAVPAWVMPLHRVYETVDAKPEVFDVIIVDEASQCGPEALPLTFLSEKIIVVGDEQQISPDAVGITQDLVRSLRDEYLYDFEHADSFAPDSSLFDHGKRRFTNRIVLREHFRCMPEIIRFSNDLFYSATPLIPLRQYPANRLEPLMMMHVPQGFREGSSSNAINRPEAEALVDTIVQCCNDERYENKTMGVIVLQGNAQATIIENMLLEQLGAEEMENRRLICGNPYSFQGDERNVIFLSMIADSNVRNVFNKQSDQRRFNVAASRAQDQMWLFHTATFNDLSQHCLRKILLQYFCDPRSQVTKALGEEADELVKVAFSANRIIEKPPAPFDSWFEVDVALKIASKGFRVIPQFPFAGKKIDLVVDGMKSKLAVECDGDYWHGVDEYEADLERERKLIRCGWQFFRIRECCFNANPDLSLEQLWVDLEKLGIYPIGEKIVGTEIKDGVGEKEIKKDFKFQQAEIIDNNLFSNTSHTISTAKEVSIEKKDEPETFQIDNIQQALAMKSTYIRKLILKVLRNRPNYSCVKDTLAGLLLKDLNVISRSKPRKEFSRKVNQAIRYLESNDFLRIYKSKNVRVRLVSAEKRLN